MSTTIIDLHAQFYKRFNRRANAHGTPNWISIAIDMRTSVRYVTFDLKNDKARRAFNKLYHAIYNDMEFATITIRRAK